MTIDDTPFFNPSDILLLTNVAGKKYSADNATDKMLGKKIKDQAWKKTILWHNLVLEQLQGFEGKFSLRWLNRGQTYTPYTWTRIYKKGHEDRDIFFTVGIDGPAKGLVYKLDYKNEGSSSFTEYQKELCEKSVKGASAELMQIKMDDLPQYSWSKLVDETVRFIKKYENQYDDAINKVWNFQEERLARITYNENGWRAPSGSYGKSKRLDAYEGENGYGHEEWLFDFSKLYANYHYSFLEPIWKKYDLYKDQVFDISLYTVNADIRKRYWIGEIKNVIVINEEDATKAREEYKRNGWLASMKEEIRLVGGTYDSFLGKDGIQLFNIKFKPSDTIIYDTPIEISFDNPLCKVNRYILLNNEPKYKTDEVQSGNFDFDGFNCPLPTPSSNTFSTMQYDRPPRTVELTFLHKQISDYLHLHFIEIYGINKVKTNVPAGYGGNKVDMIIKTDKGLIYYEIKTYDSLRVSIREALGQILEYALWPDQDHAIKFVILTQPCEDTDTAQKYFKNLRKKLGIDIYYQSYDYEKGILTEEM